MPTNAGATKSLLPGRRVSSISGGLIDGGGGGLIDGGSGGFHEEDHPRDAQGRFAGSGGGAGGGDASGGGAASAPETPPEPKAGKGKGKKTAQDPLTRSAKSILAKQTSRRVGKEIQRYSEEHNEPILAAGVAGAGGAVTTTTHTIIHKKKPQERAAFQGEGNVLAYSMPDNEPTDVIMRRNGKVTDGIELKTMTENKNNKITVKRTALERKKKWMAEEQADFHTVVFDDQKIYNLNGPGQHGPDSERGIYYKRGCGAFNVGAMYKCKDMTELRQMLDMPLKDLPKAAQPPAWYQGQK